MPNYKFRVVTTNPEAPVAYRQNIEVHTVYNISPDLAELELYTSLCQEREDAGVDVKFKIEFLY